MNQNDIAERALAQARELQNTVSKAVNQSAEQMKPLIQESLNNAQALQKTLSEHAAVASAQAQEQTNKALGHLSEFLKIGSDALKASAEQTRQMAQTMMDQSKKTMESTAAASGFTAGSTTGSTSGPGTGPATGKKPGGGTAP